MTRWTYTGSGPVEQPTLRRSWEPGETKDVAEGDAVPLPGVWVADDAPAAVDEEQPAPDAVQEVSET